jgi:hypothetical protein
MSGRPKGRHEPCNLYPLQPLSLTLGNESYEYLLERAEKVSVLSCVQGWQVLEFLGKVSLRAKGKAMQAAIDDRGGFGFVMVGDHRAVWQTWENHIEMSLGSNWGRLTPAERAAAVEELRRTYNKRVAVLETLSR